MSDRIYILDSIKVYSSLLNQHFNQNKFILCKILLYIYTHEILAYINMVVRCFFESQLYPPQRGSMELSVFVCYDKILLDISQ